MQQVRGFAPIGMLEYWAVGILRFGKLGCWFTLEIPLDMRGRISRNGNSPFKSTFHYSSRSFHSAQSPQAGPQFPTFHYSMYEAGAHALKKTPLFSISCRISETSNQLSPICLPLKAIFQTFSLTKHVLVVCYNYAGETSPQ